MELVKSISIDNLLNQREAVIDRFRRAQALLAEAEQVAAAAGITAEYKTFHTLAVGEWHRCDVTEGEKGLALIIKRMDAWAWDKLLHESGIRTFMHADARKKWDDQIRKLDCPPLTREAIADTFQLLYASRGQMMEDGVVDVFRRLSWHYKTNLPQKFGKRLVITSLASPDGSPSHWGNATNSLDDLVRVFCLMDGKPEPDHRQGMHSQIYGAKRERFLDHEYFTLRWFKNGNGHLTFKRADLVDQLNQIVAKRYPGALPYDHHSKAA